MNFWHGMAFLGGYLGTADVRAFAAEELEIELELAKARQAELAARTPRALVSEFLRVVRSGLDPDRAGEFLSADVIAHQINAEHPEAVQRSPRDYAEHVNEFRKLFGDFRFEVTELIAEGDKVYARWVQRGCHIATIDGHRPTRQPLIEYASAVYRVENGRIAEYWIQIDRAGLQRQLEANAKGAQLAICA
jgi:predicted ester cyclase